MIIKDGISEGVRSEVMAIAAEHGGEKVHLLIAGATMCEAAHEAFETPGGKDQKIDHWLFNGRAFGTGWCSTPGGGGTTRLDYKLFQT